VISRAALSLANSNSVELFTTSRSY
jgi:hypothetical protein